LQGLNKAETALKYGEDWVLEWRRSFTTRPPGGESLEDTQKRVLPFFKGRILAHIKRNDNVLVSAHGNSLRAIIMELDNLEPEQVPGLELDTGVPIVYHMNAAGTVEQKEILRK